MNQALRDLLRVNDEELLANNNVLKDTQVIEQVLSSLVKMVFEKGNTISFTLDYHTAKSSRCQLKNLLIKYLKSVISQSRITKAGYQRYLPRKRHLRTETDRSSNNGERGEVQIMYLTILPLGNR